ncbi:MAG TPA: ABC transporter substrate-binding protein [Hyphomicrobiaceae bacterium]|nr:ABC transporter substrate-binding protein [Hyphomicrobiaceae bacterium]
MTKRILSVTLLVTGCLLASPVSAQQRLTVATYGGNWGEAQKACILDPFAKASGVQVAQETSVSTVTYNKLKQQKGNPSIDIAWIDGGISELAAADGVVATIDAAKVANVAGLIDEAVYKKDGKIYALSTGFYALGIAYNTAELKTPPQSWWDIWKPEYAGKITLPSPVNAAGIPFFAHIIGLTGGTLDNPAAAVDKLKAIKVSSYYDASGVAQAALQSGEAIAAAYYNTATWAIADKGLPIAFVVPKEGAPANDIRVHIADGTKNLDAALAFVNYTIGDEAMNCLAEKLYIGPPTKQAKIGEQAKARMPWGASGSVKNLAIPNWDAINAKRQALTETWNRQVAGK